MKKIGKKLSYLTKLFLVFGILFNNLSSLAVVFADELENNEEVLNEEIENTTVENDTYSVNLDENKIVIKYLEDLSNVENVKLEISEKFTYTNECEDEVCANDKNVLVIDVTDDVKTKLVDENGYTYTSEMLENNLFEGIYNLNVALYQDVENGRDITYFEDSINKTISFGEGMEYQIYGAKLDAETGIYKVSEKSSVVKVVGRMQAGGLKRSDNFTYSYYDELESLQTTTYTASDILVKSNDEDNFLFVKEYNVGELLSGHLYGSIIDIETVFNIVKNDTDEVPGNKNEITVKYLDYGFNGYTLWLMAHGDYDSKYNFYNDSVDGKMYIELGSKNSLFELYDIANKTYGDNELVKFVIVNQDYEDVVKAFEEGLEEYLKTTQIDASTKLIIMDEEQEITITYEAYLVGDVNGDNVLDEYDLLAAIDGYLGNKDVLVDLANLYSKGEEITLEDLMYLDQIIKTGSWTDNLFDESDNDETTVIDAKIEVVDEDYEFVSGDEIVVNYQVSSNKIINGIAGTVNFDPELLELVAVKANNIFKNTDDVYLGNINKDTGKFFFTSYRKNNILAVGLENNEDILLTFTFKALKSATFELSIEDPVFFDNNVLYNAVNTDNEVLDNVSLDIMVGESNDDTLASMMVNGEEILESDIDNYEINVKNDVTSIDLAALKNNVAANVTIDGPESLDVGKNIYTITVVAEDGTEREYTVTVNREAAPEPVVTSSEVEETPSTVESTTEDSEEVKNDLTSGEEEENLVVEKDSTSRIIIIILILLVIAGLIYLIFKDDDDDKRNTNREIKRLKKKDSVLGDSALNYKNDKNNKKGR